MHIDIFNYDFRRFDTEHAISTMRRYLQTMEAQIDSAYKTERAVLDARGPEGNDEEDYNMFRKEQDGLDDLFQEQLVPAMRYSLVTLLHTVFETRLRAFCEDIKKECALPLASSDLRGSPIDQVRTYLVKLARLDVSDTPDWERLVRFQKVRNSIVHSNGFLEAKAADEFRNASKKMTGLSIDDSNRLRVTRDFCEEYLAVLDRFFRFLFKTAGWKDGVRIGASIP